ncbi:MFS transporter [Mycolicibacterium brisbanense]|uniref:Major facilitator superfamily protein n=1 Tax=Mycolicibacterium brisbanense TaxID=146020 RepID=A0A100VY52_9MYCO|nr:MFS transporter [Mycolicibacterium brisbanense]MCV7160954.1 MFS transporter [Mycolicibacterium brisbanense]GAS88133.1 major facilitator superfamily protein [Mycolicibacterium brisbanense]
MTTGGQAPVARARLLPLYAAAFVTAFGAHSIAASLAGYTQAEHTSLLTLGLLLAVYDGAEVLLKPVFGTLADRVGARPVLLGGLVAFALASAAFVLAGNPGLIGLARFGQGAAAAAFSPAAGAMVARLTPATAHGRAFGSYGAWKGIGYTLGPVLGGVLITVDGYRLLFSTLAVLAAVVAGWALVVVPSVEVLPKKRQTVVDLARRLASGSFLRPTAALAGATAALAVGVGFLPAIGARHGLGPLATGAAVSVLAAAAALIQPRVGRARDAGRLRDRTGMTVGLLLAATGIALATVVPALAGILLAAVTIGAGTGLITPLGFAHLAQSSPPERLGQTMGSAEIGRELGDAGGPLLVGAVATALTLNAGMLAISLVLAALAALVGATRSRRTVEP